MKYCDNCGAQLQEDAIFCDACGAKQELQGVRKYTPEQLPRKRRNKAPIILVCTLVILGLAGAGVYYWVNHSDRVGVVADKEEEEEKPAGEEQEKEESEKEVPKEEAKEETSDGNVAFIGKLDQSYQAEGLGYDTVITVSNQKGNTVDVNIDISDGLYDTTYYGTITADSTIQISLDGGEKVNLMWQNETMLHAVPADGFTDDSIRMMRMLCESLNNTTYKIAEETQAAPVKAVQPPEGTYWEGDAPPHYANYYVEVSNVTDEGFDFIIYARNSEEEECSVVFRPHTAVYTDTYTAVYYGQEYTLTFRWQELGYMTVEGFEERIPSGSSPLYNNAYLGVS